MSLQDAVLPQSQRRNGTTWPACTLIFLVVGALLSWGWGPDVVSSAAPPAEAVAAEAPLAAVQPAASQPQDGWSAGERYDAKKVATVSPLAPKEEVGDELAPEAPLVAKPQAPAAQTPSPCRKHLRTLHVQRAAPPKAGGLLDPKPAKDSAAKIDSDKAVAILNQRIRRADECLDRIERGG